MGFSALVRTKDVDTVIHQNDEGGSQHHTKLGKQLSARDLMGFGIGIVIGTGIFTLTGVEAKNHAGPAVVISFGVAGAIALLAALCYAELAAAVPTAGSSYTYAYTTIGEIFAWIIAWDLILEFALGAAVVARGWSGYLQSSFGLPEAYFGEENSVVNLGAVAITVVLGVVAAVGIREAKWVTNALVAIKVSICVFVVVIGIFFVKAANYSPYIPPSRPDPAGKSGLSQPLWQWISGTDATAFGLTGVLVATAVVFFAYSGFEAVANLGEETKDPAKDMPRGLIGTLIICTVLYLAVCAVLTGMVKYTGLSEGAPISDAFDQVGFGCNRWCSGGWGSGGCSAVGRVPRGWIDVVQVVSDPLDVEHVFDGDVVAGHSTAHASRPQGHGRADAGGESHPTQGPPRIDQNPECRLLDAERHDGFLITRVDHDGVSVAAEVQQLDGALATGVPTILNHETEHRSQLLPRQGELRTHAFQVGHQYPGRARNVDASKFAKPLR